MTNEEFKEQRLRLNMTQQQLADELGIALRTVQYYEGCGGEHSVPGPVAQLVTKLRPKRGRRREATDAV